MEWHPFDKAGKWLIQHQTSSVLRLGGVTNVISCRPRPAELVQPGQLPDGLIEATLADCDHAVYFLVEFATKAERRLTEQLARDMMMVYLNFGVVPEVLPIILSQRGRFRAESSFDYRSNSGRSHLTGNWNVTELWTIPAERFLETNDVGLLPWVPLTAFEQSKEVLVREVKDRIDQLAPPNQRAAILGVATVLTSLRFKNLELLEIFGGKKLVDDAPALKQLLREVYEEKREKEGAEIRQQAILRVLKKRFGRVPATITKMVKTKTESAHLDALLDLAAICVSPSEFESGLSS